MRSSRVFIALSSRAFSRAADSPLARPECPLRQSDFFAMAARPPRKQLQVLPFSSWIVKVPSPFVTVRIVAADKFFRDMDPTINNSTSRMYHSHPFASKSKRSFRRRPPGASAASCKSCDPTSGATRFRIASKSPNTRPRARCCDCGRVYCRYRFAYRADVRNVHNHAQHPCSQVTTSRRVFVRVC